MLYFPFKNMGINEQAIHPEISIISVNIALLL